MDFVVEKLIDFSSDKDEELRDISSLGSDPLPCIFSFLTVQSLQIFRYSSQDHHSGAPSRKPNRTESLRETVTKAPTATVKCKYTPCMSSFPILNLRPIACYDTTRPRGISVYPFNPLDKIPGVLLKLYVSPPSTFDAIVIPPSPSRSQACYHHYRTDNSIVLT